MVVWGRGAMFIYAAVLTSSSALFFSCRKSVVSALFVEATVFSPLNGFDTYAKNQLDIKYITRDPSRWAAFAPRPWRRRPRSSLRSTARAWAMTSTPTSASVRRSPLSPARTLKLGSRLRHTSHKADSERPCERLQGERERERERERDKITFPRSQPWIRSLKLILTLRRCWSSWTLAVCPTCGSLSLQSGWISKHHTELFESFHCNIINKPPTTKIYVCVCVCVCVCISLFVDSQFYSVGVYDSLSFASM